jgi:beta-lactamase regulating signal transducer with metallopeptidase domain
METLVDNFIKAIGWSIFHSLWQGALVYGILLMIVMGFPKLSSKTKHNLAYTALCVMFMGFCITFFSLFNLPQESIASSPADPYFGLAYTQYLSELPPRWSSFTEGLFPYIVAMYGLGLVVQIILLLSGYQRILKLKQAGRKAVPAGWAIAFQEIKNTLKIGRDIGFYLSSNVNVPLVIGYFKPVVLFPVALATQMDLKQVEAILIHELSHIRRNDYLFNLAKTVMETVLFFNPFIWLSSKFINIEREHACDDLVLKHTGAPLTYAHALLKLELLKSKDAPMLSLAATGKTQHLYQRIKRITDMKTNYMNAKQRLLAISLTIATIVSLAWVSPLKSESVVVNAKAKLNNMMGTPIFEPVQEISEAVRKEASTVLPNQDTLKKKRTIWIVPTDEKGNTKEYNSLEEIPDSVKRQMNIKYNSKNRSYSVGPGSASGSPAGRDTITLYKKLAPGRGFKNFDSSDPKKIGEEARKIAEEARKQAEEIRKYYNSPEWKQQIEEIAGDSKAAGRIAKEMEVRVNSPAFRAHLQDIMIKGEKIREKFNSEDWKKQMEELKEFQNSKEFKELQEKQKKELDKLKKKKGIKADIDNAFMGYSPTAIRISGIPSITIAPAAPDAPAAPAPSKLSAPAAAPAPSAPDAPAAPKAPSAQ